MKVEYRIKITNIPDIIKGFLKDEYVLPYDISLQKEDCFRFEIALYDSENMIIGQKYWAFFEVIGNEGNVTNDFYIKTTYCKLNENDILNLVQMQGI